MEDADHNIRIENLQSLQFALGFLFIFHIFAFLISGDPNLSNLMKFDYNFALSLFEFEKCASCVEPCSAWLVLLGFWSLLAFFVFLDPQSDTCPSLCS